MSAFRLAIPLILSLVLVTGCVTPEEYDQGQAMLKGGHLEEAYKSFSAALAKADSPEDKAKIQQALDHTKKLLADRYLDMAAQTKAGPGALTIPRLQRSVEILTSALPYDDAAGRIAAQLSADRAAQDALQAQAQKFYDEAIQLANQQNFEPALGAIAKALALHPQYQMFQQAKDTIGALRVDHHAKKLEAALGAREWGEARRQLQMLSQASPNHPLVAKAKGQIEEMARQDVDQRVGALSQAGRWYSAYKLVQGSGMAGEMGETLANLRAKGGAHYLSQSQKSFKSQKVAQAYVAAMKAMEMAPQDPEVFRQHQKCEDAVDFSLKQHLAVAAFDSPSNDPDAGRQFSDDLVSYLFRLLPYGTGIVERQKIDLALKEKGGDFKQAGELLGVDMIIIGNVSLLKVDQDKTTREATARVRVGQETVSNPEYYAMLSRFGNDQSQWPKAVPPTITKDRFDYMRYRKGTGTMFGFINVAVRVFEVDFGTILYSNVFKKNQKYTDTYQDPVPDAEVPVKEDPLQLPTETEIKEKLKEEVITKIAQVVIKYFRDREVKLLGKAKQALERRTMDQVVEFLAKGHVYCKKAGLPADNPAAVEINQLIMEVTE